MNVPHGEFFDKIRSWFGDDPEKREVIDIHHIAHAAEDVPEDARGGEDVPQHAQRHEVSTPSI